MFELYDYQQAAVDAVLRKLRTANTNPLVVIPTAGGKSFVIAALAHALHNKKVLIITPRRRLLEQNSAKLRLTHGVNSGQLGRATFANHNVIIGTYQSLIQRDVGHPDYVIVDEAHLIPDCDSKFAQLLANMPGVPIIGLSATPFRGRQTIYGKSSARFQKVYEIPVTELIKRGFILPPKTIRTGAQLTAPHDNRDAISQVLPAAIATAARDGRKRILVFCSDIAHAQHTHHELLNLGERALIIHSKCSQSGILDKFEASNGERLFLVNAHMLTTGVDLPIADAVVVLRKIDSVALWIQIVGRVLRRYVNQKDGLVLDFGGNVTRFGTIDNLKLVEGKSNSNDAPNSKTCPCCQAILRNTMKVCPHCGHLFGGKPTVRGFSSDEKLISCSLESGLVSHIELSNSCRPCELRYTLETGEVVRDFCTADHGRRILREQPRRVVYERVRNHLIFHSSV